MGRRALHGTVGIVATLALASAGCVNHHHHHSGRSAPKTVRVHQGGPPPHAPAHGHRHKHRAHGVELVFDSQLGVYVVIGHQNHYFHGDRYYKRAGDVWYVSVEMNGRWAVLKTTGLPRGLRKAAVKRAKKRKAHKHGHPAKHGY